MKMNFQTFITRDAAICGGEPVVTGTRVTVRTVLASLTEGMDPEEVLVDFPTLIRDAIDRICRIFQDLQDNAPIRTQIRDSVNPA